MNLLKIFTLTLGLLASTFARADMPTHHGMLLFGDKTSYASHLPMLHGLHGYQVLTEVVLYDIPRSMTLDYYQDAKDEGETLFTMLPETFDLTKLISGEITSYQATLYKGHFERNGEALGPVEVKVKEVIFGKKISTDEEPSQQEYLVFGSEGEYFATHIMQINPTFHGIFQVGKPYMYLPYPCDWEYPTRRCGSMQRESIPDNKLPMLISSHQTDDHTLIPVEEESITTVFLGPNTKVKKVVHTEILQY